MEKQKEKKHGHTQIEFNNIVNHVDYHLTAAVNGITISSTIATCLTNGDIETTILGGCVCFCICVCGRESVSPAMDALAKFMHYIRALMKWKVLFDVLQ